MLIPQFGVRSYALLSRPPLPEHHTSSYPFEICCQTFQVRSALFRALDLHVLGTPPAFILSQDQTLHKNGLHRLFPITQKIFRPVEFAKRLFHWAELTLICTTKFSMSAHKGNGSRTLRTGPGLFSCVVLSSFYDAQEQAPHKLST